jgi:hypothetical protein
VAAPALLSRALAYLAERGSATADELAQHVFGGPGFESLLAPLLQDERLAFDGREWRLRDPAGDLAILEILASGPDPRRHRIVELAAKRGGARFRIFVWSARPVPRLLRRLGLPERPDAPDAEWLPLEDAAADLRRFLAGATVAGFGCSPHFLEQLLGPGWPAIDLLRLARTAGIAERADPARLAQRFGLAPPLGRRPEALLAFDEALFEHLRDGRSLEDLRALAEPRQAAPPRCPTLPSQPGVYVMSDARGEALYVGKSVDLRRRVASYLRSPIALSRNMHDLLQLAERIEVVPVSSEVEALMVENALIREWLPPFNIQRQTGRRCRYLRLSVEEAFPRLSPAQEPAADGAVYFGPFRSATAAARLRSLLDQVLRLRTCTRQLPPRRKPRPACARAAAGACLAPCVIGPPPTPYSTEVEQARRLLAASAEEFRSQLRELLRSRPPAAPEARKLKRRLETLSGPPPGRR